MSEHEPREPEPRAFPQPDESVIAGDDSYWTWRGDHWEQNKAPSDAREDQNGEALAALSVAHRVYALAFGACRVVKREDALTEHEPPEAYVHALAHSALIDAIIRVVAPPAQGTPLTADCEDATRTRLRALLGDPEMSAASAKLAALRQQITDEETPDHVVVKAREHRTTLGEIAVSLPMGSDARNTIESMMTARQPPQPGIADKLFRELIAANEPVDKAWRAHSAASAFAAAFA